MTRFYIQILDSSYGYSVKKNYGNFTTLFYNKIIEFYEALW